MPRDLGGTEITPMDLRASVGELLDRVRLRHDTFIISRRGEPMAALVPVEKLRMMEEIARKYAKAMLKLQEEYVERQRFDVRELEQAAGGAVARHRAKKRGR